ncbi:hypothetical protein Q7C36_016797 [Tachysurus vachellii]|uniref:Uncharacterized protein n=1 Tax=Tachysurus vachellii TaxID=175792 RepID=A0AA88M6R8_TACVA|nr:hypothetical protein Q7C36_016797 [Tachysurus vachellii]
MSVVPQSTESEFFSAIISLPSCGDVLRQQPLCPQPTALGDTEERDVMASEESNENRSTSKTFEIFYPKNYSSDYPDDSRAHCSKDLFANHKQCQDRKVKEIDNYFKYLAKIANMEPVNTEQISLCREGSRKSQSKSARRGDKDKDIHKIMTMILQQMYSPRGSYGNQMGSQTDSESSCTEALPSDPTTCRDSREVKEEPAFGQQPAKQLSLKKKKKSPRKDDNDDDSHETLAMICPKMYSPSGPYGNRMVSQTDSESSSTEALPSDCTTCRDDREVEKGTAFGQQPAKQLSLKKKRKSPRVNDNDDDNHETLAMIRQQMYSPSGRYGNRMLNQLEPSDLASSSFNQQANTSSNSDLPSVSNKASGVNQTITSTTNQEAGKQQKSRFTTGSQKLQNKNNNQSIKMIRQQLYSPGRPYDNMRANLRGKTSLPGLKRCRDGRKKEKEPVYSHPPTKKLKVDFFKHRKIPKHTGRTAQLMPEHGIFYGNMQAKRVRYQDYPEEVEDNASNQQTANNVTPEPLQYGPFMIPKHMGDNCYMNYLQSVNDNDNQFLPQSCGDVLRQQPLCPQPTALGDTEERDVMTSDESNENHSTSKTFECIYLKDYSSDYPDDSRAHCSKDLFANHKQCQDMKDKEIDRYIKYLARIDNMEPVNTEQIYTFREGSRKWPSKSARRGDNDNEEEPGFAQQPAKQPSLKKKKKSPRVNDNDDDNHETLAMIRQQMYSPSGSYGNWMVSQTDSESSSTEALPSDLTTCRDDREVEKGTAFGQQPAKQLSLKKKKKSPRVNDNDDDNHETLAMIRQQMYSPSGPYGNRMLNQLEPSDLAPSSFDQQANTNSNSDLPSVSNKASGVNQIVTSTTN